MNNLSITYTPEGATTTKRLQLKKGIMDGLYGGAPAGVTIDQNTGLVTLPDRLVKDNTEVSSKSAVVSGNEKN